MTPELLEALKELKECSGQVYDKNYNAKEKELMKDLQKFGLVELCWVITPKGEEILK